MHTNEQLRLQKQETRQTLKNRRGQLSEATRLNAAKSITEQVLSLEEVENSQIFFIYISYATEVYTHDLIKALLEAKKTLAVPKIVNSEFMEAETFSSWEDLVPGDLGILTPSESHPCQSLFDIAITPGLGFTLSGHRMGFGRGYYDKWFAEHQVKHKIGLAFEAQIVDSLPIEPTDIPMDKIVTEERVICN